MNKWTCVTRRFTLAGVFSLGLATVSHAQEACSAYVVQVGDTIGSISITAFGKLDYQTLFNANADVLRANPSAPPPGTVLNIPCEDGSLPATAFPAETPASVEAPDFALAPGASVAEREAAGAYVRPPRFFTGDQWAPFSNSKMPSQGLFVSITLAAYELASADARYTMSWIDDWDAHSESILPQGAMDLAIGYYEPNCASLEQASDDTIALCEAFAFSDPIYDSVFGFYTLADTPFAEATTFDELKGARLCRSEGNSFHDLEAQGLREPDITISIVASEWECIYGLTTGDFDVASFEEYNLAQAMVWAEADDGMVVQNPNLSTIQSASVMAYRGNERAVAYLAVINEGLASLRASGEWNELVRVALEEAAEIPL